MVKSKVTGLIHCAVFNGTTWKYWLNDYIGYILPENAEVLEVLS